MSKPQRIKPPVPKPTGTCVPLVGIKDLHKTFTEGVDELGKKLNVRALRGVSFDIYPGEFIAITGPNGSGKSTLVNCLGAFERADPPDQKPIQYAENGDFHDVWEDPEWYRQNFVGIVFQDFHLLPTLRVDQNVEFPLRLRQCRHYNASADGRRTLVTDALRRLGIGQHAHKKVDQISGGERQRVAIARALVKEPRLLLADEPTGNLDQQNKIAIVRQLRELARGNLSVLMVTHDRDLAKRYADRIIHLVDGEIESEEDLRGGKPRQPATVEPGEQPVSSNAISSPARPEDPLEALPVGEQAQAGQDPAPEAANPEAAGQSEAPADNPVGAATPETAPPADRKSSQPAKAPEPKKHPPKDPGSRSKFFLPGCSQSLPDLVRYSLRDARQSTISLASNVFAILLGTFLTAMLLALLGGTEQYIKYLFRTIPGIDSVQVWVDYSAGEAPMTAAEVKAISSWPGAQAAVSSVNQFVPLFQKPTREAIASLFSTQKGDPEVLRLPLAAGSRVVNPEGWDVILPMRIAQELNNFNPQGLAGSTITLQLRRYARSSKVEDAKPTETLDYPVRVVGVLKASPQDRVYGSLNMVRFVRDFSTGRSSYVAEPGGRVDLDKISARTMNESLRIHFGGAAAAEMAFLDMKRGRKQQRFESSWPGEKMLYLRDVETVSTIVLIGIGLLAVVAGAVSIFNTLLASVARKTKEIGIMRALGVARADIFLIFLSQSVIIGTVACLAGLIVAGMVAAPLNAYIGGRWDQLTDAMKAIGGLFQFNVGMVFAVVAVVLAICLVAAFLPALRAARKTPMDALREQ